VGAYRQGFDLVIGNPPYVRADVESETYLGYRRLVEQQQWFTTRHLKWDLYVPFVEQAHRLLADGPAARACLITIDSLASVPYAENLRELLVRKVTVTVHRGAEKNRFGNAEGC
jgi:methylase of polypeptide subunit release factors